MRCSKIIIGESLPPGKILVVCVGQTQKDEGAKGEGRHSVSAKITAAKDGGDKCRTQ